MEPMGQGLTPLLDQVCQAQVDSNKRAIDPEENYLMLKSFKEMIPVFTGESGPEVAYDWIYRVEMMFKLLECPDDRKVTLATFVMQGAADNWWEYAKKAQFPDNEAITWEAFRKVFYNRYFPSYVRMEKKREFLGLTQGSMSVVEYESKFYELARFIDHPDHLFKLEDLVKSFVWGLRVELRAGLLHLQPATTLSKAVELASKLEYEFHQEQQLHKAQGGSKRNNNKRKGKYNNNRWFNKQQKQHQG